MIGSIGQVCFQVLLFLGLVDSEGIDNETVIEYFNEANLRRFLENPMDVSFGIL